MVSSLLGLAVALLAPRSPLPGGRVIRTPALVLALPCVVLAHLKAVALLAPLLLPHSSCVQVVASLAPPRLPLSWLRWSRHSHPSRWLVLVAFSILRWSRRSHPSAAPGWSRHSHPQVRPASWYVVCLGWSRHSHPPCSPFARGWSRQSHPRFCRSCLGASPFGWLRRPHPLPSLLLLVVALSAIAF